MRKLHSFIVSMKVIIFIALILLLQLGNLSAEEKINSHVTDLYKPILSQLQQKTKVPLKLPNDWAAEEESNPLYAILEKAEPNSYEIQVAFTPDCGGGTACHYGSLFGKQKSLSDKKLKGTPVKLANGKEGYFQDAVCKANCSDSTLTWDEGNYRYTITFKAGSVRTLTRIVNSTTY